MPTFIKQAALLRMHTRYSDLFSISKQLGIENKNVTSQTFWNQAAFDPKHRAPEGCVNTMLFEFRML